MEAPSHNSAKQNGLYLPELDGLRFFAFLLVFIHHHPLFANIPYLSFLHTHGWVGVDLFLTLSAFLFTKLLRIEIQETQTINLKKFFIRRIFRIWPIYFLLIGASTLLYILQNGTIGEEILIRIIGLFAFFDNIMVAIYSYNPLPYSGHLWTITYEEQFYVFIPAVMLLLVGLNARKKRALLVLTFLVLNIIKALFIANDIGIWTLPITHFESVALGIVIGFGGFDFLVKRMPSIIIGLIGCLFFALLYALPNNDTVSYWLIASYACVGIATSMTLMAILHNAMLKRIFSYGIFVFLGKRSYGLYIYHLFGIGIASYILKKFTLLPSNGLVSFSFALVLTSIAAIISYQYIEKPFLRWKKHFETVSSRPI